MEEIKDVIQMLRSLADKGIEEAKMTLEELEELYECWLQSPNDETVKNLGSFLRSSYPALIGRVVDSKTAYDLDKLASDAYDAFIRVKDFKGFNFDKLRPMPKM